jgi:UDP-3-O-[3-hydroxymyristoyl] N-acetylglucosamine deacetylase/UDP-3-O-[3-hydroxymyristoyl] N-acetylglucosamine deacetylase/3-hydroxyacyl-[acyl-carrier-protein] dehydratase
MRRQRTIAREATVNGIGLFGSADVTLRFLPAPENHGIAFQRVDVSGEIRIPALIDFVVSRPRRTALCREGVRVETVEHVMAALAGLQIDNCLVMLDAPEPPAGDGSAQPFVDALHEAGFVEQAAQKPTLVVTNKVHIFEMDHSAEMLVQPSRDGAYRITYELDYGNAHIPAQSVRTSVTPDLFADTISFARTFVLEEEVAALQAQGYGLRMTPQNLLVFGEDGPIENQMHVEDECARHKLLDCIGDLALAGCDLCGTVTARRSGHRHTQQVVRDLMTTHPHIRDEIEQAHVAVLADSTQTSAA